MIEYHVFKEILNRIDNLPWESAFVWGVRHNAVFNLQNPEFFGNLEEKDRILTMLKGDTEMVNFAVEIILKKQDDKRKEQEHSDSGRDSTED